MKCKTLILEKSMATCFLKCKFTDSTVTKALTLAILAVDLLLIISALQWAGLLA